MSDSGTRTKKKRSNLSCSFQNRLLTACESRVFVLASALFDQDQITQRLGDRSHKATCGLTANSKEGSSTLARLQRRQSKGFGFLKSFPLVDILLILSEDLFHCYKFKVIGKLRNLGPTPLANPWRSSPTPEPLSSEHCFWQRWLRHSTACSAEDPFIVAFQWQNLWSMTWRWRDVMPWETHNKLYTNLRVPGKVRKKGSQIITTFEGSFILQFLNGYLCNKNYPTSSQPQPPAHPFEAQVFRPCQEIEIAAWPMVSSFKFHAAKFKFWINLSDTEL